MHRIRRANNTATKLVLGGRWSACRHRLVKPGDNRAHAGSDKLTRMRQDLPRIVALALGLSTYQADPIWAGPLILTSHDPPDAWWRVADVDKNKDEEPHKVWCAASTYAPLGNQAEYYVSPILDVSAQQSDTSIRELMFARMRRIINSKHGKAVTQPFICYFAHSPSEFPVMKKKLEGWVRQTLYMGHNVRQMSQEDFR